MKTINIGRGNNCDIILTYDKISRCHAQISLLNGQYLYYDMSKNGSNIGGQIIVNQKMIVAPGTTILLANKIPLPWEQVYRLLPLQKVQINSAETNIGYIPPNLPSEFPQQQVYIISNDKKDELGVGLGILAFIIPLAGWIMYLFWKNETPNRAKWAGIIGTISFIINLIAIIG